MPFPILSHLILKTTSKASIENHVSKIQLVNYAFTGNFKCSRKNVHLSLCTNNNNEELIFTEFLVCSRHYSKFPTASYLIPTTTVFIHNDDIFTEKQIEA